MKDLNTRFAIMEETPEKVDFLRDGNRVCVYSLREAKRIVAELKEKTGYNYSILPYMG